MTVSGSQHCGEVGAPGSLSPVLVDEDGPLSGFQGHGDLGLSIPPVLGAVVPWPLS